MTMFKKNAEPIIGHLFSKCKAPYDILGQEQCMEIEITPKKFFHYGHKMHYMKILSNTFSNAIDGDAMAMHNTLLIDNSPDKSICNANGSAIFVNTWSYTKQRDDILMENLLLWL